MRKTINISALIVFIWLVFDACNAPSAFLYFIVAGELPGTNISLSPSVMLALTTLAIGIIVFELLLRHVAILRHIRSRLHHTSHRNERLPNRRFSRI